MARGIGKKGAEVSGEFVAGYLNRVEKLIDEHGFAVQTVLSAPTLAYTIGLSRKGHPELLMTGLDPQTMLTLLNALGRRLLKGELEITAQLRDPFVYEGYEAVYRKVDPAFVARGLSVMMRVVGESGVPDVWQLLWPDVEGRFPGDPEADAKCVLYQEYTTALEQAVNH